MPIRLRGEYKPSLEHFLQGRGYTAVEINIPKGVALGNLKQGRASGHFSPMQLLAKSEVYGYDRRWITRRKKALLRNYAAIDDYERASGLLLKRGIEFHKDAVGVL